MKTLSIAALLLTFTAVTAGTSHAISEIPEELNRFSCASQAAAQHQVPANILLAILEGADSRGGCRAYDQAAMRIRHEIATGRGDLWQRIARYRPEHGHTSRKELVTRSGLWADKLGRYRLNDQGNQRMDQAANPLVATASTAGQGEEIAPADPIDQAFDQPIPAPPGGTVRVGLQSGSANQARQVDAIGQLINTRNLVQCPAEKDLVAAAEPESAAEEVKDTAEAATRPVAKETVTTSQTAQSQGLHTDAAASLDVPRDNVQAEVPTRQAAPSKLNVAAVQPSRTPGDQHLRWQPLARENSIQGILSAYHAELFVQAQNIQKPVRRPDAAQNTALNQALPKDKAPAVQAVEVAGRNTKTLPAPDAVLQVDSDRTAQQAAAPVHLPEKAVAASPPSVTTQNERIASDRELSAAHTAPLNDPANSGWEPRKRSETMDAGLYQTALKF